MSKKDGKSTPPWFRARFDMEGLGFGALALVLAILSGAIPWIGGLLSLFFWIAVVVIVFASRDVERTSPTGNHLVLSPCDGVVVSVSTTAPPRELRWDTPEVRRVRISSSPFSVNGMRSPITGNVESFLEEEGAPSALSLDADNSDLREAFVLFSGEFGVAGVRIATGGLGPRLDIDLEAGDGVRAGRKVGVRRLGGWCDIFLPLDAEITLESGMTVVGGETVLTSLEHADNDYVASPVESAVTPPVSQNIVPDTAPDTVSAASSQDPLATDVGLSVTGDVTPETVPDEVEQELADKKAAKDN